jgi:hypothetical protein
MIRYLLSCDGKPNGKPCGESVVRSERPKQAHLEGWKLTKDKGDLCPSCAKAKALPDPAPVARTALDEWLRISKGKRAALVAVAIKEGRLATSLAHTRGIPERVVIESLRHAVECGMLSRPEAQRMSGVAA